MTSISLRRRHLRTEILEDRAVPAVTQFGGDAQHTGISAVAAQPLETIHWQATVDSSTGGSNIHYGAPIITAANTVIYPVKTGSNSNPNFHVIGKSGNDGTTLWDVTTDWFPKAQSFGWFPAYQPVISSFNNRVYYAGAGGTIYYRTNADSGSGTVGHIAFYGALSNYTSSKTTYDNNVHVDTPLTVDNLGNIFFGFRVTGNNPANLVSGVARIDANGVGTWVSAQTAAGGDTQIDQVARYSAMALSNDGSTLYFGTRNFNTNDYARLVGVNSTTLASQFVSGVLKDPRNNGANNAVLLTDSTASPMVAPDGRVFYGIFGSPSNGSRGFMLQFSANLTTQFAPGGFGWDNTASIVPTSMVPQYTGTSPYLIFTKDNNYVSSDGDGSNKIAVLDPNDTEVDTHSSSNGLLIMKRVLFKIGPVADWDHPTVPTAVREWCLNHAAIDVVNGDVMVNSSDGFFYRWHLATDTLTEAIQMTSGYLQPYTATVIGSDGTMYGIQDGIMFAVGKFPDMTITDTSVTNLGTSAQFTVSLDFPRMTMITANYATADGSASAGTQYTATSGMLAFTAGQKTKTITVPVNPAAVSGVSADFFVNLSNPGNANIADAQGQATIYGHAPRIATVNFNGGDSQRSMVTSLQVEFDQPITLPANPAAAFQLVRQSDNATVTLNGVLAGTGATLTFAGGPLDGASLADGRYTLSILAAQVSGGNFDGNGDGIVGDNFTQIGSPANGLFRLYGDSDGNGTVDGADFLAFRLAFLGNNAMFDVDGDGIVSGADFLQFRLRFLQMV